MLIEPILQQANIENNRAGFLSALAIQLSHSLNYPIHTLHAQFNDMSESKFQDSWTPLIKPFPCDIHFFALRTISSPTQYFGNGERVTRPSNKLSLIVERAGVECATGKKVSGCNEQSNGKVSLMEIFNK